MTRILIALALLFTPAAACEENTATHNGRDVFYLDTTGESDEAIVLIHGWASDHSFMEPLLEGLHERARILSIDLPGHGKSEQPADGHTMDAYADAIAAAMDDAGVRGAVLIGHSNGVPTIRQFQRRHPGRTLALVGIDGAFANVFPKEMAAPIIQQLEGEHYLAVVEGFAGNLGTTSPTLSDDQLAHIRGVMVATHQDTLVGALEASIDDAIWTDDKVDAPVLVLQADTQWFTSDEYLNSVRALGENVEIVTWGNVGHFIQMEKPDETNAEILRFLDEHELVRAR